METCDCCGKKVDDRSLATVGKYFVCQSCHGYYSDKEIIAKIRAEKR